MSDSLSLRSKTTMKVGGPVEVMVTLPEFLKGLENGRVFPKPIRVLGNGSNILIDDRGLKGTVIVTREGPQAQPNVKNSTDDFTVVECAAGLYLPGLANWALQNAWTGCEYMIGVPGTVGGALVQNAGANGQEFSEIFESAEVLDLETGKTLTVNKNEAKLDYRTSVFKDQPNWVILSCIIKLKRGSRSVIEKQMAENQNYRRTKTPFAKPSLGSVYTRLKNSQGEWIYPGKLIEDAGLKGRKAGGAQISTVHANYIVNNGQATFTDVIALMKDVQAEVLKHSGVELHREVLVWSNGSNPLLQ